jgi:hypothetical protein
VLASYLSHISHRITRLLHSFVISLMVGADTAKLHYIVLSSLFPRHIRRKTFLVHFLSGIMEGASIPSEFRNFYCYLRK